MRRSVVISVVLHGAILLWIVVMFPLGRALNESPKDIPLDIMSPAEFTKLKAGMAHAKADKPLKAKAEEPKPKAVTEKKPVEQATPAPTQKPAEKKPKPKPKTVVAPKPKKALAPKQAEATPKKVRLLQRAVGHEAVLTREARTEAERAGRTLDHLHFHVELLGNLGRLHAHIDLFEKPERLDSQTRQHYLTLGVELALDDRNLAADDGIDRDGQ